ncbi:MAG: amidohydrolase family protein [Gemmatimonadales bacterium]|nr:amidohydrolase family protein [Gemmatimonadales bacterium]
MTRRPRTWLTRGGAWLFAAAMVPGPIRVAPERVALVGATVIDGTGAPPVPDATILVEGDSIVAVGPRARIRVPADAKVIDVAGRWILPGFVDLHMHLTFPIDQSKDALQTNSEATVRAISFMDQFLRQGITSVRDVAAPIEPMQAILRGLADGSLQSVRVFPVGQLITTTGGHGAGLRGATTVDGPWAFRKAVRTNFDAGFRHIKLSPMYTLEEGRAAVDEAKTLGMRITSHGGGLSDTWPKTTMTRVAVEAGVQCIEHLNQMDDDVLDLIAQRGVHVVPTLAIYRELYRNNQIPPELITVRHWSQQIHEDLFRKAHARKILMGVGTDAVSDLMRLYPGLYVTELEYFTSLGMTPMEALVAGTRNGGIILGNDRLGTLEPGKLADLQVIDRDPLQSFSALGRPRLVMVGGRVHRFDPATGR